MAHSADDSEPEGGDRKAVCRYPSWLLGGPLWRHFLRFFHSSVRLNNEELTFGRVVKCSYPWLVAAPDSARRPQSPSLLTESPR